MPLATTLRSVAESNSANWPLDVRVLTNGFSERSQKNVLDSLPKGSASIRWVPVDLEPFGGCSTAAYISDMTYARFLIPHIVSRSVNRVLYLDADLLVLEDLRPLWETDLGGAAVGAVLDSLDPKLKRREAGLERVPRVSHYFNAGVLLVDVEQWRKQRVSEKALEYLTANPQSPYSDQDALNVVCDGRWKQLPGRWNFHDHFAKSIADMDQTERPAVVHFVTGMKPWKPSSRSPHALLYDTFRSRTHYARNRWDRLRDGAHGALSQARRTLRGNAFLGAVSQQGGSIHAGTTPRLKAATYPGKTR
jgi:lipopolysaccharide biosynthesis glycosyltransferase